MALEVGQVQSEWVKAHEALSRLARTRAAADAEEGRWLLAALRSAAHVHLGFGSFGEYAERLFGYTARSTQEKLRVAEALEELPAIARALEGGELNWSAVRELTRVAVASTEREWLKTARGRTVHQLEALVAGKLPGDSPASPAKLAARRHVLRFEVSPETLCLFRETLQKLRPSSPTPLDHDAALLLMARQVLAGPRDQGRSSYQVALSVCPACGEGRQQASGEPVPVGPDVVAMADCDGQHLGLIQTSAANESVYSNESVRSLSPWRTRPLKRARCPNSTPKATQPTPAPRSSRASQRFETRRLCPRARISLPSGRVPSPASPWFVYILRCADDTLYTGIARDVAARLRAHEAGRGARYTRSRGPLSLCAVRRCLSKGQALRLEHCIKQLSRVEKQALLRGRRLSAFARICETKRAARARKPGSPARAAQSSGAV
jgi:putative endonuclease